MRGRSGERRTDRWTNRQTPRERVGVKDSETEQAQERDREKDTHDRQRLIDRRREGARV